MNLPNFETEWDGFRGYVAMTWDELSDSELIRVQGDVSELVRLIMEKYHEKKTDIEDKVETLFSTYLDAKVGLQNDIEQFRKSTMEDVNTMAQNLKEKASDMQNAAKEHLRKVREEKIDPLLKESEDYIKVHPFGMVLGAFGVGLLLGTFVTMISRRD